MNPKARRYDFKSARERQEEWKDFYRRLKRAGDLTPELEFEIMAYIDELEHEIADAVSSSDAKMTILADGHAVLHIENIITPILPQWNSNNQ